MGELSFAETLQKLDTSNQEPLLFVCELDTTELMTIPSEYTQYTNVFSEKAESTLSPLHGELDHNIDLKPRCTAPFRPLYNLSEHELTVLKDYIKKNLDSGFISHSKSSARAPILFIKKKDGSLHLCVNY